MNATQAFIRLCERTGVKYRVPEGIDQMCCGTPWKSKGYTDGYSIMSDRVLKALWQATDGGASRLCAMLPRALRALR